MLGVNLTPEQTTAVDSAQDGAALAPFFAMVNNQLPKFKASGRSEVWDESKALLKQLYQGDDFNEEYFNGLSKLDGKDAITQHSAKVKEHIETLKKAAKKAAKDGDPQKQDDINAQIIKLNNDLSSLKDNHTKELASKDEALSTQRINSSLAMQILMSGNLADNFKNRDFINRLLVPSISDQMAEEGFRFSDDTLKIVDKDGNPKFGEDNKPLSASHYIAKAAEPYAKKADSTTTEEFTQGGNGQVSSSAFGLALAGG